MKRLKNNTGNFITKKPIIRKNKNKKGKFMSQISAVEQVSLEDAREIAKSYHQKNNFTLAERTYIDILNAVPDDFKSLYFLSVLCYQQQKYEIGIDYAQQALKIDPDDADTLNVYGVLLSAMGEYKESVAHFEKAIKQKADFVDAYNNLSHSLWQLKEYEAAQTSAQKAVEINPNYADGYINLGAAFIAQQKNDEAMSAWEKAIELNPNHPSAHINLGNILRDQGRIQDAKKYCLSALKLMPDSPEANMNYANILRDLENLEEAEVFYRKAISIKPSYVDAHNNLSLLYLLQGKSEDAATSARFANAFDNKNTLALNNLSTALRAIGKLVEAETITRRSLYLKPDSLEAKLDLADILLLSDKLSEAETLFSDALKNFDVDSNIDKTRLFLKLSVILERANRLGEALDIADKAIESNPQMPDTYHRKAQIYFLNNQLDNALEMIQKGLDVNPNAAMLLGTKAEILQSQGLMEESLKTVRKALLLGDSFSNPTLYYTLSKVKKFVPNDPDIIDMEAYLKNNKFMDTTSKSTMHFNLFKAYQDIKDDDKAFDHLKSGNDQKSQIVLHDRDIETELFNKIKSVFSKKSLSIVKETGYPSEVPVFIVGMPRSGTTLTEQIIASHPDVFGAGELYYLSMLNEEYKHLNQDNNYDYGQSYVKYVQNISEEAAKAKRITDKMPGNYMYLGQIVTALPNAKIIHCKRNPIDTCLSCYKQYFTLGHYWSYNLDDMAEHYKKYADLIDHWRNAIPDKFIEVSYEDTVNDLETQARRLIDYVGLEWNDACLTPHKSERSILTASKGQVRKPVYKTSVEAWRRYEDQLAEFAQKLEPYIEKK